MSKVDRLREWFTLEEAAQRISKNIDENITVTNLYRFALDGYLKFSIYFVNSAYGVKGELCKVTDSRNQQQQDFIRSDNPVQDIKGIWDLTMQGREAVIIKGHFEHSNSGVEVKESSKNGIILEQYGVISQLYEPFDRDRIFNPEYNESEERIRAIAEHPMKAWENHPMIVEPLIRTGRFGLEYLPCNDLPENNCVLIIKKNEVANFIQSLESTSPAQKDYKKNTDKLEERKAKTQAKYQKWQDEAVKIKDDDPTITKSLISAKIAKMAIAENANSETIRKKIKI
jgi:hypothetical protein